MPNDVTSDLLLRLVSRWHALELAILGTLNEAGQHRRPYERLTAAANEAVFHLGRAHEMQEMRTAAAEGALFDAIKRHHAARGHARCWENDAELYRAAGLEPGDPEIPDGPAFARRCAAYYREQTGRDDWPRSSAIAKCTCNPYRYQDAGHAQGCPRSSQGAREIVTYARVHAAFEGPEGMDRLREAVDAYVAERCAALEREVAALKPPPAAEGAEHWEGCFMARGHGACAVAVALEARADTHRRSMRDGALLEALERVRQAAQRYSDVTLVPDAHRPDVASPTCEEHAALLLALAAVPEDRGGV